MYNEIARRTRVIHYEEGHRNDQLQRDPEIKSTGSQSNRHCTKLPMHKENGARCFKSRQKSQHHMATNRNNGIEPTPITVSGKKSVSK